MLSPPSDPRYREEWDLLHELRDATELMGIVTSAHGDELKLQTQLRRRFPDRLVRGAFALCELRRRGTAKFSRAAEMWFDRQGLEQATAEPVARHKARRFQGDVWDWCSGIGGDALALAEHCQVTAVDCNPVACLRTEWNADVYGVREGVTTVCRPVEELSDTTGLVHIDPDRRRHPASRAVRVEDYVPGLDFLQHLTTRFRGGAIKLSPASNFGGKFPDAEIELTSLHGECKEATVWFGELAGTDPWRATLLPSGLSLAGNPADYDAELAEPRQFIFDPDPAIVRAGLVDLAAAQLGLERLDSAEEFLTGPDAVVSPVVQAFELLADLPNNPVEIRDYFRRSNFGQVEIKCRHIPISAEAIRRKLPLEGHEPGVLIIARVAGGARALVCRRLPH